jgi:hypothetical protein
MFLCLPDCWLQGNIYKEGPAIDRFDTSCLGFPLSSNSEIVSEFPDATPCLSCSRPDLNSSKLNPLLCRSLHWIQDRIKPLLLTLHTPWLACHSFQKDERTTSGELLAKRCSSLLEIKVYLTSPCFPFSPAPAVVSHLFFKFIIHIDPSHYCK